MKANERILVIDHKKQSAIHVKQKLRHLGYQWVSGASSGKIALRKIKEKKPHLVLINTHLSGEFDGFETARRIYKFYDVPVVFVAEVLDRPTLDQLKSIKHFGFLSPTFEDSSFQATIEIALSHSRNVNLLEKEENLFWPENGVTLNAIIDSIKDYAIFVLGSNGSVQRWNNDALRIHGYSSAEISNLHYSVFFTKEDQGKFLPEIELSQVLKWGRVDSEGWRLRRDGSAFWANVTMTLISDNQGKIQGFIKLIRDVSEYKKVEHELDQQKKRLNTLISQIPGVLWESSWDAASLRPRVSFISNYVEEMLGHSVNEWMTNPNLWYQIVHPEDRKRVIKRTRLILKSGKPGEDQFRLISKSGKIFWIEAHYNAIRDALGQRRGLSGIYIDISERKRAEEWQNFLSRSAQLLTSSLDFQMTLRRIKQLVVPRLSDGIIVEIYREKQILEQISIMHHNPLIHRIAQNLCKEVLPNPGYLNFSQQVGKKRESILIPEISDLFLQKITSNPQHLDALRQLKMKSLVCVPLVARDKVLGTLSFISSTKIFTTEDLKLFEELTHRAALAIDNSKLYARAQKLVHIRDEFLSIASHELKTPITSLKLQLQITKRAIDPKKNTTPTAERLMKVIDISDRQVNRLTHLVEDLLDVSRIQAGKLTFQFEKVKFSEIITDVVEKLCKPNDPLCELDLDEYLIGFWDRARIEQVLINLISNANKYAPGALLKIKTRKKDQSAVLVVEDFGPGIPNEMQERIFERFERASSPRNVTGLGLGLYISKQIVQAHRGSIRVKSEIGKGSQFIVELPLEIDHQKISVAG